MSKRIAALGAALAAAVGYGVLRPAAVQAQPHQPSEVTVAITDTLSASDARALVMRYPDARGDVIVLKRRDATPELLAGALWLLAQHRRVPPRAGQLELSVIQGSAPRTPLSSGRVAALNAALQRLAHQPTVRIGNLGRGQWLRLPSTQ